MTDTIRQILQDLNKLQEDINTQISHTEGHEESLLGDLLDTIEVARSQIKAYEMLLSIPSEDSREPTT